MPAALRQDQSTPTCSQRMEDVCPTCLKTFDDGHGPDSLSKAAECSAVLPVGPTFLLSGET